MPCYSVFAGSSSVVLSCYLFEARWDEGELPASRWHSQSPSKQRSAGGKSPAQHGLLLHLLQYSRKYLTLSRLWRGDKWKLENVLLPSQFLFTLFHLCQWANPFWFFWGGGREGEGEKQEKEAWWVEESRTEEMQRRAVPRSSAQASDEGQAFYNYDWYLPHTLLSFAFSVRVWP